MNENVAAGLRPVDLLEALVLVDNVSDALSTTPPGVVGETAALIKAGMTEMSGEAKCCAHHGLSLVLAVRCASTCLIVFGSLIGARSLGLAGVGWAYLAAESFSAMVLLAPLVLWLRHTVHESGCVTR